MDCVLSPIIRTDISKSHNINKEIKYLELPVFHSNFEPISEKGAIPIPKITRIILGYQFKDNFEKVKLQLEELALDTLGYKPEIVKSRLTKWYHETI